MKKLISDLEAEASAVGSDEYHACVQVAYATERTLRHKLAEDGTAVYRYDFEIESGQPAGTVFWEFRAGGGRLPNNSGIHRFDGQDKDIVRFEASDFGPETSYEPYLGNRPGQVEYTRRYLTTRPLPVGTYRYFYTDKTPLQLVCNKFSEFEHNNMEHFVTVTTTAARVLHEAFFDPVDIGDAVGADGTNGVLKPAAFALDGVTTTIQSLKWQNGTVTMKLKPSASLAGNAIDFISLDGSVALTLSFDDAAQGEGGALTWSVANQPWQAGDLLMLRIGPAAK